MDLVHHRQSFLDAQTNADLDRAGDCSEVGQKESNNESYLEGRERLVHLEDHILEDRLKFGAFDKLCKEGFGEKLLDPLGIFDKCSIQVS